MAVEALKVSLGSRSYFSFLMEIEKAHHLLDGGLFSVLWSIWSQGFYGLDPFLFPLLLMA